MADEEEVAAAAPEPVEEVEMSVLDALKEVSGDGVGGNLACRS